MKGSRFKPGDRVVYTSWDDSMHGIGGTVIEVHQKGGIVGYLLVILDTAERVLDEHGVFWLESEYNPAIPF